MWWDIALAVICLLVGFTTCWQLWVKKVQGQLNLCQLNRKGLEEGLKESREKADELVSATSSIYTLSFGAYGTPPQAFTDAFNRLWILIGKAERGVPR